MASPAEIVERLGGHPAARLGLDLEEEDGLFGWLVAACLLSGRVAEERALAAFRALQAAGLAGQDTLAGAAPERVL